MATKTKILKITAILALQAFCLTQSGLAALQKAQNLRPREIGDEAQAGAVGREHEITKDLLPGQAGVQFTDAMPIEGVIKWVRERVKAGTLKDVIVVINNSGNLVVLASRGKLSNIIDTNRDLLLKILGTGEFDIVCSPANPSFALVRPAEEIEAAAGAAGRGMLTGQGRQRALEVLEGLRLMYYAKGPKNVPSIGEPAPFSSDTPPERLRAFQRFMRDPVRFTEQERAGINNELNSAGLNLKDDWGLLGADRASQASAIGEDEIETGTALLTEENVRRVATYLDSSEWRQRWSGIRQIEIWVDIFLDNAGPDNLTEKASLNGEEFLFPVPGNLNVRLFVYGEGLIGGLVRRIKKSFQEEKANPTAVRYDRNRAFAVLGKFANAYSDIQETRSSYLLVFRNETTNKINAVRRSLINAVPVLRLGLKKAGFKRPGDGMFSDPGLALRDFAEAGILKDRDTLRKKITNGVALVICPDAGRLNEIKARLKPFGFEFKDIVDAPSVEEAKRKIGQISQAGQAIVVVINDTGNDLSEAILLGIGQAKVVVIDRPKDTARAVEEAL